MEDAYLKSLLGENEKILYVTRRHWLVLLSEILSESLLSLALIVLVTLVLALVPAASPWVALAYLLLVFPLASLSRDTLDWLNRKYVITTRRVIHVQGVLNKDVTDSSLEKVNDVKLEQSVWGRLLDFGDVEILTASELGVNKFNTIARPIQFKTAMLNAKNRLGYGEEAPGATPQARSGLLEHMPARHAEPAPARQGASGPAPAGGDVPALLRQLDELRQAGVLTEAEFQQKKAQLLARL